MSLPSNVPANPNANAAPEAPEWDALSLDVKLSDLASRVDCLIPDDMRGSDYRRALDTVSKLEELSGYVFEWMKNHGEVL